MVEQELEKIIHSLVLRKRDLEKRIADGDFDSQEIADIGREIARIDETLRLYEEKKKIQRELDEWKSMIDEIEPDQLDELNRTIDQLEKRLERLEFELFSSILPPDALEDRDVILEIRAGAGGEESALFGADLLRMYTRYAERKGWTARVVEASMSDLGGFKSVVLEIEGRGAFSRLRFESGVHRVQRIPVTESGGRIHTSTATVAILPKATEVDVKIDPKDLKVEVFRASGHGGQHVNRTESAVRITHLPTGIVATCQSERSQHQNKERALEVLRARLYELERRKQQSMIVEQRREQIGSGDRSEKIRTYNFPQNRVTDHRINYTTYRLQEILDGDLDEIIDRLVFHETMKRFKSLLKSINAEV
ncbi:MAG: peptide chain release factor 1 [Thermotogota bacterium]|nr:peptide chain release factor 1 [Thermotogota bacterium]MDK2863811.1 peptide chain release factor 1 [Thermotogota bacterium]HCZ05766.1 peptide chain release factor 1 [Thermotogota bacterium]